MMLTITKLDAALHLLDRAIEMYLDRRDFASAVVLGGSAEDMLQDLLDRDGRLSEAARASLAAPMVRIRAQLAPTEPKLTERQAFKFMRAAYNWLRHNDEPDEPQQVDVDFLQFNAGLILYRAIENRLILTNTTHPRAAEVVAAQRANEQARDMAAGAPSDTNTRP